MPFFDGQDLISLMLEARLSAYALSRKSGLPLTTVQKAIRGGIMSEVIYNGLKQACAEEIANRTNGPAAQG
jgi:hypothetical protein